MLSFRNPMNSTILFKFDINLIKVSKSIVITGGPGTGKTTLVESLKKQGFECYPEISREITLHARQNGIEQLFLSQPLLFSELLLEGRKKQYSDAIKQTDAFVFMDRGMPDILAYMHYIGDPYPAIFDVECKENRYHQVFLLPPWEAIYVSDDARYETFEQAQHIFEHLKETYTFYGYEPILVPLDTPENRVKFILNHL